MRDWRSLREFPGHFGAAFEGWRDDSAPSMGAALAFYTLFSMAPLLFLVADPRERIVWPTTRCRLSSPTSQHSSTSTSASCAAK